MSNNASDQPEDSQKAILAAVAEATKKVLSETEPLPTAKPMATTKSITETSSSDQAIPPDSAAIDLENESIEVKRQRQRSLVLNLGKRQSIAIPRHPISILENITPSTPSGPEASSTFSQPRRSFSSQATNKPSFKGYHEGSSSDDDDSQDRPTTSTSEIEEETSDTGARDIDYSVLYDDTIEDFSFSSAREQAKKRLLRDQQEMMLKQIQEQE